MIGTAIAFHYINRMANVLLSESPFALPSAYKGIAGRLFGETAGKMLVRRSLWRGDSLRFVPRAKLPNDMDWAEDIVIEVKEEHQAAARLTLLTALASYQVDPSAVKAFQTQYPEDSQLIAATAWASFTAARRVGVWFAKPDLQQRKSDLVHSH